MSIHLLLPALAIGMNLGLLGVVVSRPWRFPGRSAFVAFLVTMVLWSISQIGMGLSTSAEAAAAWHRLLLAAAMFYPAAYLRFSYSFSGHRPDARIQYISYSAAGVGMVLSLAGVMANDPVPGATGFAPRISIFFIALVPLFYATGALGLVNVWRAMVHAPSATMRNRARYIAVGSFAMFALGSVDFVSSLGYADVYVAPGGHLVFAALATAAALNTRVADLRQVLRRQAAHLLMVPLIGGTTLALIAIVDALVDVSPSRFAVAAMTVTVYALVSPLIHQRAHRWIDTAWYGKRDKPLQALRHFGAQVRGVHDMQLLSATMVYVVREAAMATHVSLLERVPRRSLLRTAASVGTDQNLEVAFTEDGALAHELLARNGVLTIQELAESAAWQALPATQQAALVESGAELIVPISFNGNIAALLLVGPRKDGHPYPQEENELLFSVAQEVAPSIENARLYQELHGQIRELKETEAQLMQAGKLATLGTLASGVAHEISNPLFSILGRVELLQRDSKHHLRSRKSVEYVEVIHDMSQRISEVVNALLTFSRRDSARAPVNLNNLIDDTVGLVERDLALSRVMVKRNYDPTPPFTSANPAKLKQALMTLILNAKDAMPDGGTVTLGTKFDNGRVLISCTDTGRGIDPQDMPYVFDAFYTTKDHGRGAGLGLYVCHSIVDEHDGHITIDSKPGDGTTVTIDLAAERVHAMPMSMGVGAGSPGRAAERFVEQSDEGAPIIEMPVHQAGGNR